MVLGKRKIDLPNLLISTVLGIIAVICVFPFYQTLLVSLSSAGDINTQKVFLYPISIDFSSYLYLISEGKAVKGILVTMIVTVFGTLFSMLVTVCGAYALSKKALPGRNLIFNGIIFTMFFSGGLVPYFLTIQKLHLQNSLLVMILPVAVNTFNLILMKNYFNTVSPSLEESAKMDGANDITILFNIILPVSLPMIAAITLFYAVDRWNEWWMAMMFINDTKKYPLQLVLREAITNITQILSDTSAGAQLASQKKNVYRDSIRAAIIVVSAVPILMVYPFLQKYFSAGIMVGSIKG
jgi:putative aldouronate transport system permease protein